MLLFCPPFRSILKDEEHAICLNFHEGELLNRELQQDQESILYTMYQLKYRVPYHNVCYELKENIVRTYIQNIEKISISFCDYLFFRIIFN